MPPKRKGRSSLASVTAPTPKTPTPARDDDAMDVDTPQPADTPVAAQTNQPDPHEVLNNVWTADQESSLFKAIMRWKPCGMHKHFRMIAIAEHLRNHGNKAESHPHTRIPGIWAKIRTFYSLDQINERENGFAFGEEDPSRPWKRYKEFDLPNKDYYGFKEMKWNRRLAPPTDPPSSPPQFDVNDPIWQSAEASNRKRKRGGGSKTRSSTVDDTEEDTPLASSPVNKSARGARSRKRAAAKAKVESSEPEDNEGSEEEHEEAEDDEDEDDEEEEEEEEEASSEPDDATTPASSTAKSTRGRGRSRAMSAAKSKSARSRATRRGRGRH